MPNVIQFNPKKCTSCKRCEAACSHKYFNVFTSFYSKIKCVTFDEEHLYYPVTCFQCDNPPCLSVCPVDAISKDPETGIVRIDEETCTGCGACIDECPVKHIFPYDDSGHAIKCDFCNGNPECVIFCKDRAIEWREITPEEKAEREKLFADLGEKLKGVKEL